MSTLKHEITVTVAGNAAATIFSLGTAIILARVLGPALRGIYGLAVLVPSIVVIFCMLGQDMVNNTYAGLYQDKRGSLFQQTLLITLIGTALSTLVIGAFYFWLPLKKGEFEQISPVIVWLTCLIPPLAILSQLLIALTKGIGRITTGAVVNVMGTAATFILMLIFLVGFRRGLKAAVLITALGPSVTIFISLWILRSYITLKPAIFSGWLFKESLIFGFQVSIANIAGFLIYRLDQGILAYLVSAEQVGLYVVAVGLAERLRLLPNSIASALLPRLANELVFRQAQVPQVFRCTMIISFGAMIFLALLGAPVLLLFFGWDYAGSIPSFIMLLPGLAALGGASVISADLAARRQVKYSVITAYTVLTVNILLNFCLIPFMGIVGAALASSISYMSACLISVFFYRRETGVRRQDMIPKRDDLTYIVNYFIMGLRKLKTSAVNKSKPV